MHSPNLQGRSILIVEDEPLIALDVAQAFEKAGARVAKTNLYREALALIEEDDLSAVVLDHAIGDHDSTALCARLKERSIPFVNYTGFSVLAAACQDAPHIKKPTPPSVLVQTVAQLLVHGPKSSP
jgi:DNA-binding NtrC family response regulator